MRARLDVVVVVVDCGGLQWTRMMNGPMRSVSGGALAGEVQNSWEDRQRRREGKGGGAGGDDDGCRGDGVAAWDRTGLETSSSGCSCYDTVAASATSRMAAGAAVGALQREKREKESGEKFLKIKKVKI